MFKKKQKQSAQPQPTSVEWLEAEREEQKRKLQNIELRLSIATYDEETRLEPISDWFFYKTKCHIFYQEPSELAHKFAQMVDKGIITINEDITLKKNIL